MIDINAFNSVKFIFAKPCYEGYYYYSLDDLNNISIIDKTSLLELTIKLGCGNFIKLNYLLDRNLPFLYYCKEKQLMEFQETNCDISKEELRKMIIDDMKENINKTNNINNYERFFGKDSTFYKNSFYKENINNGSY